MSNLVPNHNMLGMRLDYVGPKQYLTDIIDMARTNRSGYCCVANVHMCILAHDSQEFANKVNAASFVIPDSVILQRARSLRYGVPFIETVRGADIMLELCRRAADEGIKVALVGGKDDQVLTELKQRLKLRFPKLDITYAVSPPFQPLSPEEDRELTGAIGASGAQLIFVGLGCPKQENWMAGHAGRLNAFILGVGAAFDFNAGVIRPSPKWVHIAGLEWLYRLATDPKRLWRRYLSTSPRFLLLLTCDIVKNRNKTA